MNAPVRTELMPGVWLTAIQTRKFKSSFWSVQLLTPLRRETAALQRGGLEWCWTAGPLLVFARQLGHQRLVTVVNASSGTHPLSLPWSGPGARDLLTGGTFPAREGTLPLVLPPYAGLLLI